MLYVVIWSFSFSYDGQIDHNCVPAFFLLNKPHVDSGPVVWTGLHFFYMFIVIYIVNTMSYFIYTYNYKYHHLFLESYFAKGCQMFILTFQPISSAKFTRFKGSQHTMNIIWEENKCLMYIVANVLYTIILMIHFYSNFV